MYVGVSVEVGQCTISGFSPYERDWSFHCVALYVPILNISLIHSKTALLVFNLTNYQRIFGKLLKEAFLCRPVDVEIQRLRLAYQQRQAHQAGQGRHGGLYATSEGRTLDVTCW